MNVGWLWPLLNRCDLGRVGMNASTSENIAQIVYLLFGKLALLELDNPVVFGEEI